MRLEPPVAHVQRIDERDQAGAAQLALQLGFQRNAPLVVVHRLPGLVPLARSRSRSRAAMSPALGRFSAMRRDRLLRTVRINARLAGEPDTE